MTVLWTQPFRSGPDASDRLFSSIPVRPEKDKTHRKPYGFLVADRIINDRRSVTIIGPRYLVSHTHTLLHSVYLLDRPRILDILHSSLVCTANWQMLIKDYGEFSTLDYIQWCVGLPVPMNTRIPH